MKTHNTKYSKKHEINRNAEEVEFAIRKAIADSQHIHDGGLKGFILNAMRKYLKKMVL